MMKNTVTANALFLLIVNRSRKMETTIEHDKERQQTGTLEVNNFYTFERFNQNSEYDEIRNNFVREGVKSLANKGLELSHTGKFDFLDKQIKGQILEHVFKNKTDGTQISIRENKIIFDNTEQNFKAALDIAQDKGWTSIKIKGLDKSAKSELWFQAQMRGLETKGYEPNQADLKRLAGAKEREKQQNQDKGIDIHPKQETSHQEKAKPLNNLLNQHVKSIVEKAAQVNGFDDNQKNMLENTIMEGIAKAESQGKTINMDKLPENTDKIKENLPSLKDRFDKSFNMEQKVITGRAEKAPVQQAIKVSSQTIAKEQTR